MKPLDSHIEDVAGTIIANDDATGALFNEKGEQQGPIFFASSHTKLKERATAYFTDHGGHNVWANGLELRIRT